jgi:hypothetical protein
MGPHPLSGIVVAMVDEFELERWGLIQPKSWRLTGGVGHDSCGVQCGWNGALLGIEFVLRSDESMKVGVYAGGKKLRGECDDGGPLYARQILGLAPILAIDPIARD